MGFGRNKYIYSIDNRISGTLNNNINKQCLFMLLMSFTKSYSKKNKLYLLGVYS